MFETKKIWVDRTLKLFLALLVCFTLNCSNNGSDSKQNQVEDDQNQVENGNTGDESGDNRGFYQNMVINKILGGEDSHESVVGMTVDSEGSFYLLGKIDRLSGRNSDMLIAKIDRNGLLVWGKIWSGTTNDMSTSITYDGEGYLYATGLVETEPYLDVSSIILKINASDGAIVWEKLLTPVSGWPAPLYSAHSTFTYAIDVDSSLIYITGMYGYVDDTDQPEDIAYISFLLGMSPDGEVIWHSLFDLEYCYLNPADCTTDDYNDTKAKLLKADGSGHLYVAGSTIGQNFLLKFQTDELGPVHAWWMGVLVGKSSGNGSSASAITLDASSNVYVSI
jgi:hypothetical protein